MSEQNPMVDRLVKQKQHISTMLPSWLMGTIKHREISGSEIAHSLSAGVKDLLITQKRPFIQTQRAAVLPTDRYSSFEKLVLQKYTLAEEFASSIASLSRGAKSWGEVDRIFPGMARKEQEERAQPGEMKRGTVIHRMEKLPKNGETMPPSKTQSDVVDTQRQRQSKRPTKVDIAPGQRLFTHVHEITGTRPPVEEEIEQPKPEVAFPASLSPVEKDVTSEVSSEELIENIVLPDQRETGLTETEDDSAQQGLPQKQKPETSLPLVKQSPQIRSEPVKDLPVAVPLKKPAVEKMPLPRAKPVENNRRISAVPPASQPSTSPSVQRQTDSDDTFAEKLPDTKPSAVIFDQPSPESPKPTEGSSVIKSVGMEPPGQVGAEKEGSTPVDAGSHDLKPLLLQHRESGMGLLHTDAETSAILKMSSQGPKESQPPIIRREKYLFTSPTSSDPSIDHANRQAGFQELGFTREYTTSEPLQEEIVNKDPKQIAGTEAPKTFADKTSVPSIPPAQPQPHRLAVDFQPPGSDTLPDNESTRYNSSQDFPGVKIHLPLRMETPRQQVETAQSMQEVLTRPQVFEPVVPTKKEDPVLLNEQKRRQPSKAAETGSRSSIKTNSSPQVVQRNLESNPEPVPQELDYDRLAEDVFPYIKHLIEIERERSLGR